MSYITSSARVDHDCSRIDGPLARTKLSLPKHVTVAQVLDVLAETLANQIATDHSRPYEAIRASFNDLLSNLARAGL